MEKAEKQLQFHEEDQRDFQNEVLKVIRGESKLSMGFLNSAIEQTEKSIEADKKAVESAQLNLEQIEELAAARNEELDEIITWADIYSNASLERKKMIVGQLIKKVCISRGYLVSVDFNITFEELQRAIVGEYAEETGISTTFLPAIRLQTSA